MGIIDDYYGGYENIAMFTDEDSETDFEGAYNHDGLDDLDELYDYEEDQHQPEADEVSAEQDQEDTNVDDTNDKEDGE